MNEPGTQLLSIGEAAAALGVAVATLRHWHRQGHLLPAIRTLSGHRHYESDGLRAASGRAHSLASKAGLQSVLLDILRERVNPLRHCRAEDRSRARDQQNDFVTANVTKCETHRHAEDSRRTVASNLHTFKNECKIKKIY